jgi:hypothetical protein
MPLFFASNAINPSSIMSGDDLNGKRCFQRVN